MPLFGHACCLMESQVHLPGGAPELFQHYAGHLALLFSHHPTLEKKIKNSIWPAATFNLGPRTVCVQHRDAANLAYGWCAITALGNFNPASGGHLILWDMKLVIEFPQVPLCSSHPRLWFIPIPGCRRVMSECHSLNMLQGGYSVGWIMAFRRQMHSRGQILWVKRGWMRVLFGVDSMDLIYFRLSRG